MTPQEEYALVERRLAEKGIHARDVYGLLKTPNVLRRAAPVLLALLSEVKSVNVKTDLLRVLSQAGVPPRSLVDEFKRLRPAVESGDASAASVAWTIGEAVRKTVDGSVYDDVAELLHNRLLGRARQPLPYALARVKSRRAETVDHLLGVLDDDEVTAQVLDALGKLDATEAIPGVKKYIGSDNKLFRTEAGRALKRLEKARKERTSSGTAKGGSAQTRPANELAETSANFDSEEVPLLLQKLSGCLEGFGQSQIEQLESALGDMEAGDEASFEFEIRSGEKAVPLKVQIYMSDENAPDIAFQSQAEVIDVIAREIREA